MLMDELDVPIKRNSPSCSRLQASSKIYDI